MPTSASLSASSEHVYPVVAFSPLSLTVRARLLASFILTHVFSSVLYPLYTSIVPLALHHLLVDQYHRARALWSSSWQLRYAVYVMSAPAILTTAMVLLWTVLIFWPLVVEFAVLITAVWSSLELTSSSPISSPSSVISLPASARRGKPADRSSNKSHLVSWYVHALLHSDYRSVFLPIFFQLLFFLPIYLLAPAVILTFSSIATFLCFTQSKLMVMCPPFMLLIVLSPYWVLFHYVAFPLVFSSVITTECTLLLAWLALSILAPDAFAGVVQQYSMYEREYIKRREASQRREAEAQARMDVAAAAYEAAASSAAMAFVASSGGGSAKGASGGASTSADSDSGPHVSLARAEGSRGGANNHTSALDDDSSSSGERTHPSSPVTSATTSDFSKPNHANAAAAKNGTANTTTTTSTTTVRSHPSSASSHLDKHARDISLASHTIKREI